MRPQQHSKDENPGGADQMIDIRSAIEELNGLSSQELNKLLKDSENFTLQYKTETGSLKQVNVEKLASSLPLHLIATLLSPDRDMCLGHVLRGIRLLHTLSDLATRHARLEQILLDDVKISEQIMDLALFILIVLANHKQDNHNGSSPVLHSALVACSLHLLTSCLSSQWHDLVHVLLAHPKVYIFMDVAFDAVHEDIRILGIKLQALNSKLIGNMSNLPAAERTVHYISLQSEASLQFLLSLCQQKVFRDHVLRNKELCKHGGILSLAYSILKLNIPQSFEKSSEVVAAVSRLKAKILSILLQLCEAESISYLDEVAGSPKSMHLAKSVALAFLNILKIAFRSEVKQPGDPQYRSNPPIGLLLLNTLRLADIFSDDSNFRSFFMTTSIPVLAEILAVPHEDFSLTWCSLNIPVIEEEVNLEFDPFTAAGVALVPLNDGSESSDSAPNLLPETYYSCHINSSGMPPATYAQQRTSCLVKIIANLHVFVPKICEEQERDLFLNNFYKYLLTETPESSGCHSSSDITRAATVCKNLSSLSRYAASLTPNFLIDEDVHLLSKYVVELQNLTHPEVRDNFVEEILVKVEVDIQPEYRSVMQQSHLMNSTTGSNSTFTGDHQWNLSSTVIKQDESVQEDGCNDVEPKGKVRESSRSQALEHLRNVNQLTTDQFEDLEINHDKETNVMNQPAPPTRGAEKEDPDSKSEYTKENGIPEDERPENGQNEDRQPRKRKRNIMNETQIQLVEKALLDEPEMQRNAALLQLWADKLSSQGSEITSSQLKNWLNNRKAKLARAAREARAPSEGDTSFPDKLTGPSSSHFCDSSESAGEEKSSQRQNPHPMRSSCSSEPGQWVSILDTEGKLVGKGKNYLVEGRWQGRSSRSRSGGNSSTRQKQQCGVDF